MLKIDHVCKIFAPNEPSEKRIFDGLSLEAHSGDFITVIGGNGAGKSTLMNLIAGSIFPDSGNIYIDNKDMTYVSEYKRAKWVGRVFQDPLKGTAPNLTIEENLSLALLRHSAKNLKLSVSKKSSELFKEKLLMLNLGLEDRLKTKVGLLSGGQRQALTLLMATIVQPKVLLLDEHTAALDPKSRDNVLGLTEKITKNSEIITLMITHNMEHALNFGNRTIMLDSGKIQMDVRGNQRENINFDFED